MGWASRCNSGSRENKTHSNSPLKQAWTAAKDAATTKKYVPAGTVEIKRVTEEDETTTVR